jgi:hypothetical protein
MRIAGGMGAGLQVQVKVLAPAGRANSRPASEKLSPRLCQEKRPAIALTKSEAQTLLRDDVCSPPRQIDGCHVARPSPPSDGSYYNRVADEDWTTAVISQAVT